MKKPAPLFWLMTLQTPNRAGYNITDYQGVVTPLPGTTRIDLFNQIRSEIYRDYPQSQGGAVIAFEVQPNEL